MSYATEANAIRSRFSAAWGTTTPVAWPNVSFTPPSGEPWVRLEILPAGSDQETMGAPGAATFWYDGLVSVQVFTPSNEGDGEARTLAEQVCAIFRSVQAAGIIYDTPWITTSGNDGAGWYQLTTWCPYRRETTH